MKGNKTFNIDDKIFAKLKEIAGKDSLSATVETLIEIAHSNLVMIRAKKETDATLEAHKT